MNGLEAFASKQISMLIPEFENLRLRATVNDVSYSIEFFVEINGERKQCYELADEGVVDEEELDEIMERIAEYIRKAPEYHNGTVNKFEI